MANQSIPETAYEIKKFFTENGVLFCIIIHTKRINGTIEIERCKEGYSTYEEAEAVIQKHLSANKLYSS